MPDPFTWVEPAALAIVLAYFGLRFRRGRSEGWAFVRDYALIAPAAWLAEDSCIRLFGFYEYAPGWHLFLDRVPLMVAAIWPFVILSARDVASRLCRGRAATVGLASAIVVCDAALIEAVATSSGLWRWNEPGPFDVPFMGFFGWGCFAAACLWLLLAAPGKMKPLVVFLAPPVTHLLLLASWWGLFKWVTGPVSDGVYAGVVATLCGLLVIPCRRLRHRAALPLDEMVARMVAASYFFGLLLLYNWQDLPLMVFTFSFALPWMSLVTWKSGGKRIQGES